MSIPLFPPRPYYTLSWPGFSLPGGECLLPVNKQENRPCHVSLGLPHSSLICENMYSGQRFQAFPQDPVSLQPSLVQTCKQTHVLKGTRCLANTVCSKENTEIGAHTIHDTQVWSRFAWACVCVHLRALLHFPLFLHTGLTSHYSFNGTLTNPENKGEPWQCSCYPSPLQSCINNS